MVIIPNMGTMMIGDLVTMGGLGTTIVGKRVLMVLQNILGIGILIIVMMGHISIMGMMMNTTTTMKAITTTTILTIMMTNIITMNTMTTITMAMNTMMSIILWNMTVKMITMVFLLQKFSFLLFPSLTHCPFLTLIWEFGLKGRGLKSQLLYTTLMGIFCQISVTDSYTLQSFWTLMRRSLAQIFKDEGRVGISQTF